MLLPWHCRFKPQAVRHTDLQCVLNHQWLVAAVYFVARYHACGVTQSVRWRLQGPAAAAGAPCAALSSVTR